MYARISAAASAVPTNFTVCLSSTATVQLAFASQKGAFLSAAQGAYIFGNSLGTSGRRGFKQAVTGFHY